MLKNLEIVCPVVPIIVEWFFHGVRQISIQKTQFPTLCASNQSISDLMATSNVSWPNLSLLLTRKKIEKFDIFMANVPNPRLGVIYYFFGNPWSKVAWSRWGSNPGPSDSHPDGIAICHGASPLENWCAWRSVECSKAPDLELRSKGIDSIHSHARNFSTTDRKQINVTHPVRLIAICSDSNKGNYCQ